MLPIIFDLYSCNQDKFKPCKIHNFVQLDEARRPDEEKSDQPEHQPDIAPEDNAIEMSEDFDGKPQDLEPVGGCLTFQFESSLSSSQELWE